MSSDRVIYTVHFTAFCFGGPFFRTQCIFSDHLGDSQHHLVVCISSPSPQCPYPAKVFNFASMLRWRRQSRVSAEPISRVEPTHQLQHHEFINGMLTCYWSRQASYTTQLLGILTLWCPLFPYGYSYKAFCARPG